MSQKSKHKQVPWLVNKGARLFLRLLGWQVVGNLDDYPKCVAVSQHSSNWDGMFAVMGSYALNIRTHFVGKKELFWGPLGPIFRFFGGIAVDRSQRGAFVEQLVNRFNEEESFILMVAPEGTRKKAEYWKTGFYYIALGANVPIAQGLLDYKNKRVGIGKILIPTGDLEQDMETLRQYFADVTPRYPENAAPIRPAPPKED